MFSYLVNFIEVFD